MSNYYVSPIWFYLCHICDTVFALCGVAVSVLVVFIIIVGVDYWYCNDDIKLIEILSQKPMKRMLLALILTCMVFIFIPTSNTIKQIIISSQITKSNVENVKGDVTELVDYIFDKIEKGE